jgi:hypothetical protein
MPREQNFRLGLSRRSRFTLRLPGRVGILPGVPPPLGARFADFAVSKYRHMARL